MNTEFEQTYIAVRKKENRIYTDSEVLQLPEIFRLHDYAKEWEVRKRSSERLITYLKKKNKPLKILEIGCGNGWLSFQLSNIRNSGVTGLDINLEELNQAKRVFKKDNLSFIYGEFTSGMLDGLKFDCIVLAASLQYFPSLDNIVPGCLSLLADEGEVHVIDTYIYTANEREHAANRSMDHYNKIGVPRMAENYFHHTYDDLKPFNYRIVSYPLEIVKSLIKRQKHFYWIIIKN